MKKPLLLILLTACFQLAISQTPNAIWEDQINGGYKYVRINAVTGIKTTVANLPPITGFVTPDISATNYDLNYYHFVAQANTNKVLYTLNRSNGAVIYSPVMTTTVVGVEYNCADSTLYGIQVNGNLYNFVKIDPVTAALTVVAPISNMQGYVGGTFSMDITAQTYTWRVLTSTVFKLRTLNVKTGAVIADNTFTDNIRGMKYSPTDNKTYGMWDDNGVYRLEELNTMTAGHTTVASYTTIVPGFYGESTSISQSGEYTFRGFDMNNNSAIFTIDVTNGTILNYNNTTDNAVGFEEPTCVSISTSLYDQDFPKLTLYPNPASTSVQIEGLEGMSKISIFNATGELVFERTTARESEAIDIRDLLPGIYFITTSYNGRTSFSKLTVIH